MGAAGAAMAGLGGEKAGKKPGQGMKDGMTACVKAAGTDAAKISECAKNAAGTGAASVAETLAACQKAAGTDATKLSACATRAATEVTGTTPVAPVVQPSTTGSASSMAASLLPALALTMLACAAM